MIEDSRRPSGARMLLRVSRPRFWLYLGGTYLVGYTIGAEDLTQLLRWTFWAQLLYFVIPANLLLYGLNDLYDAATDRLNPKKGAVEHRLSDSDRPILTRWVLAAIVISLVFVAAQKTWDEVFLSAAFLVLSAAYSMPPVRFKSRPVLDSASNILYALPGFLAYRQASGLMPPIEALTAAGAWTAAMHLFSAIPDIESDREAGVRTTATAAGRAWSLVLCSVLWLLFAWFATAAGAYRPWSLALFLYPLIPAVLISVRGEWVERVYWWFPGINAATGMACFFTAALQK